MTARRCPNDHEVQAQGYAYCPQCGSEVAADSGTPETSTVALETTPVSTEPSPSTESRAAAGIPLRAWKSMAKRPMVAAATGLMLLAVPVTVFAIQAATSGTTTGTTTTGAAASHHPRAVSLTPAAKCVATVLKHLRINFHDTANNTSVNTGADVTEWMRKGAVQTPEWVIFSNHNFQPGLLAGKNPEAQLSTEAPKVVADCADEYGETPAAASQGLGTALVQGQLASARSEADHPPSTASTETVPESVTPRPRSTNRWADPALWDMDCSDSADPTTVDVHHTASGDVNSDGVTDTVVAASCHASTSPWPDSVVLFDGADPADKATFIDADTAPRKPVVDSLSIDGDRILVAGSLTSKDAPNCCPDFRFSDTFALTGEEWRRLSHEVWPGDQPKPVGYGAVKIGMTREQLLATGQVLGNDGSTGCTTYDLSYGGNALYSEHLRKVVAIFFEGDMATSKGIKVGSPRHEVRTAYPNGKPDYHGYWTVEVTPTVHYRIGGSPNVDELALEDEDQDCYG